MSIFQGVGSKMYSSSPQSSYTSWVSQKELVYMAAYLDPHTSAELSLDDIKSLCDDLFEAHNGWLPEYK